MIETLTILTGIVKLDPTLFFTFACNTSRHGHIYKLYKEHAPRRVREQSLGVCIVNEWNNLPSWVVEAVDLDMVKQNLDSHWHVRQYRDLEIYCFSAIIFFTCDCLHISWLTNGILQKTVFSLEIIFILQRFTQNM